MTSKILQENMYVKQRRGRYDDKRGRVYRWNPEARIHQFVQVITKMQCLALMRHHPSEYCAEKDGNGRWHDITVIGDFGAFMEGDE